MSPFGVLFIGYNLLFLCCIEKVLQFDCISHVSYLCRTTVVYNSNQIRNKYVYNSNNYELYSNYIRNIYVLYSNYIR